MSRYIDEDALIEELERCSYDTWSKGVNRTWWAQAVKIKDNIVECIKRQPTADVVEVRHREWIGEADGYADGELVYDVWYCSECNYCIDDGTDDADLLPNYCPNCGAKMDGERREENDNSRTN